MYFEKHGIDIIPENERAGTGKRLFYLWFAADFNYAALLVGVIPVHLGLSFYNSITAIIVANFFGALLLSLSSLFGPKTGTSCIMTSVSAFGIRGSLFPIILSAITCVGWFSVLSIIATDSVIEIFTLFGIHQSAFISFISICIVLFMEIIIAVYGHSTILKFEKIIFWILIALFLGIFYFVLRNTKMEEIYNSSRVSSTFKLSTWFLAVQLVFSYPLSWANYASDYTRYLPKETSWKKIFFFSSLGIFAALTACQILGVFVAYIFKGSLVTENPAEFMKQLIPAWFFLPFLVAIVASSVAANVINGYSASLGLQAARVPLKRVPSLMVIAVLTLIIRIISIIFADFLNVYENVLGYVNLWIAPWASVVIADYFLRKGNYNSHDLMIHKGGIYWYYKGFFNIGLISFIAGISVSYMASVENSFIQRLLGCNLSFALGFIVPTLLYCLLYKIIYNHPKKYAEL